jgi:hypothetical protein
MPLVPWFAKRSSARLLPDKDLTVKDLTVRTQCLKALQIPMAPQTTIPTIRIPRALFIRRVPATGFPPFGVR